MSGKEVSEALFSLRQEVEHLKDTHPELKNRLETLLEGLEEKLEASEEKGRLHLLEDLKETVAQFEAEHPRIGGILNELMVTLSNLGI
ncbi:MAG: DUF4404 family protein [Methylococcaceae bacterium]|jgi:hypothetical protein